MRTYVRPRVHEKLHPRQTGGTAVSHPVSLLLGRGNGRPTGQYVGVLNSFMLVRSLSRIAVVTSGIATQVDLSDADCRRWDELEFQSHAVLFECSRCDQSHTIDRRKIVKERRKKKVYCVTYGCDGVWCRQCHTELEPGLKHRCEGRKELKQLMKQEGWKNCPGWYPHLHDGRDS